MGLQDMQEEVAQNHRLLKIIVITLGVLILIMLGTIVTTIAYRLSHGDQTKGAPAAAASGAAPIDNDLDVPAGSHLLSVTPTEREVYLQVRDGLGADHLYVLDRRSGDLLWHRRLAPAQ